MYFYEKLLDNSSNKYLNLIYSIEDLKQTLNIKNNNLNDILKKDVYNSTKIEGNTLTRKEVTYYLDNNVTVRGKSLKNYLQVSNYKNVLDAMKEWIISDNFTLSEEFILYVHKMVTENELPEMESGVYRDDFVHIKTTNYIPPAPDNIQEYMKELIDIYNSPSVYGYTQFEKICEFKRNFERIHPFFDGNGRTGRVLMNTLFLQNNYPCISIPAEERDLYFDSLENNTFHEFAAEKMYQQLLEIQKIHINEGREELNYER